MVISVEGNLEAIFLIFRIKVTFWFFVVYFFVVFGRFYFFFLRLGIVIMFVFWCVDIAIVIGFGFFKIIWFCILGCLYVLFENRE